MTRDAPGAHGIAAERGGVSNYPIVAFSRTIIYKLQNII
jgi:hypothetical protein